MRICIANVGQPIHALLRHWVTKFVRWASLYAEPPPVSEQHIPQALNTTRVKVLEKAPFQTVASHLNSPNQTNIRFRHLGCVFYTIYVYQ